MITSQVVSLSDSIVGGCGPRGCVVERSLCLAEEEERTLKFCRRWRGGSAEFGGGGPSSFSGLLWSRLTNRGPPRFAKSQLSENSASIFSSFPQHPPDHLSSSPLLTTPSPKKQASSTSPQSTPQPPNPTSPPPSQASSQRFHPPPTEATVCRSACTSCTTSRCAAQTPP